MSRGDATGDPPRRRDRIIAVTLDEKTVLRRAQEIEHERAVAIYDLIEENQFCPVGDFEGPYALHLSLSENRLVMDIKREDETALTTVVLPLTPFRTIIKDYFQICESYFQAIRSASPSKIEAIDMGRRGLHNEGSELLRQRLEGKVAIDDKTARRLFTLLCVLHFRA
ncbi:MAG: UPF0262 family protein [Alphaproteobacteria bacterium]|nr:UPF0262 family protein [Alphaproteobacteria bacterium]